MNYLNVYGREFGMCFGMLLILIQQVGLYEISFMKDGNSFLWYSFLFQIIGGLGSGNNSVASLALVISDAAPEEREMQIGLIETSTGVGFLLGPLWGSAMYQAYGYPAPFGFSGKSSIFESTHCVS